MVDDRNPPPQRREIVERREIVRDEPAVDRPPNEAPLRQNATVWLWMIPLLLVVIGLVWYILTQGEPRNPLQNVELRAPAVEAPSPGAPRAPATPAPELPAVTPAAESEPAAEPAPAAPAAAEAD